jgi:glycosyltransferase involved in cell wall biosynthesis
MEEVDKHFRHEFVTSSRLGLSFSQLSRVVDDHYDLVYANTDTASFSCILGRLSGTPLIFDMHGLVAEEYLRESQMAKRNPSIYCRFMMYKLFNSLNTRLSDMVVCVSQRMVRYLLRRGVPSSKLSCVPNGVNLDQFKPMPQKSSEELRTQLGLAEKFVFGYAGGFESYQGIESLLRCSRLIENDKIAFLVIGAPRGREDKNAVVLERIPHSALPRYYAVCDVLVLPRPVNIINEVAAPTKFAEYVSMGKPVLVTDVGDAAEMVKVNNCGIVVSDNRTGSLIDGMRKMRTLSSVNLAEMGKNARLMAEKEFDWQKIGKTLEGAVRAVAK